ncbi:unnamed protein product, partial [Ilex paraguariensis]
TNQGQPSKHNHLKKIDQMHQWRKKTTKDFIVELTPVEEEDNETLTPQEARPDAWAPWAPRLSWHQQQTP